MTDRKRGERDESERDITNSNFPLFFDEDLICSFPFFSGLHQLDGEGKQRWQYSKHREREREREREKRRKTKE